MSLQSPFAERLTKLRQRMAAADLPALLILKPENRRYLSGFAAMDYQIDESSGCLLITPRRQFLLTDFRYDIQARQEAKGFEVVIYQSDAPKLVAKLVKRFHIRRLGFEEVQMNCRMHRLIRENLPDVELVPEPGLVEKLRVIKGDDEVRLITKALRITEKAFEETLSFLKPGRTEIETARYFENRIVALGAEGPAFDSIVASGPNAALPHAVPSNRKIREGETIIFDIGARYRGYQSDMSRTVVLGRPKTWIARIYNLVRQAQLAAINGIRAGMPSGEADALARRVIEEGGYGPEFGHSLGHGVGLAVHEAPSLSRLRSVDLEPGMVMTIEPGIYLEGRGGVRLEEMALITQNGVRVLNRDKHFYNW